MDVLILVPAYNEEKNIGELLKALVNQKIFPPFSIKEIVVVASGCTDRTEEIVRNFSKRVEKIKLISTPKRLGKAAAINLFLKIYEGKCDIIVMISADTLPADKYTINTLLQPFLNDGVGIVTGRGIPVNPLSTLTTKISTLIWHVHHKVSLYSPKAGEIVAFRNVVKEIPANTLADEERISATIQRMGYKIVYAKDAVVYMKSPEKISELIEQRKRIFIGHLLLKRELGYTPPTMRLGLLIKVTIKEISLNPRKIFTIFPLALLEIFCRVYGFLCFLAQKYEPAWKVCETTKKLT